MPANDSKGSSDTPGARSHSMVLGLLCAGTLLALAGNVYQFVEGQRLARSLALVQRNVANQFAEIKEVESGILEQNLRRFDEFSKQFEGMTAANLREARIEVRRSRSELTMALERKQKEVVSEMSELKSDLKQDASAKVSRVSADLDKTRVEFQRAVSDINVSSSEIPANSEEQAVATQAPVPREQPAPAARKKTFWGKLNPFKRNKEKTDLAGQ
ncbi:MAG: hypothetical protein LAP38_18365 [Acidobacteriia bacterium]|nr:hypothetical protein [Terriglobia bacterium]